MRYCVYVYVCECVHVLSIKKQAFYARHVGDKFKNVCHVYLFDVTFFHIFVTASKVGLITQRYCLASYSFMKE